MFKKGNILYYMIVLSIDVGIRNLAYIILKINDIDNHEILKWDVLELIKENEKANKVQNTFIGESLYRQFDSIFPNYIIDIILIENQIGQNAIKMKTIQGMINMYFIMKQYPLSSIINYNAIHKLKPFLSGKKTTYAERKKLSKKITLKICDCHYDDSIRDFYKSFKKKDDLADCLLQALDYIQKKDKLSSSFYEKIGILL